MININELSETNIFRKLLNNECYNGSNFSACFNISSKENNLKVKNDYLELICRNEFSNIFIINNLDIFREDAKFIIKQDSLFIINFDFLAYRDSVYIFARLLNKHTRISSLIIISPKTPIEFMNDFDLVFSEEIKEQKQYILKEGKLQ